MNQPHWLSLFVLATFAPVAAFSDCPVTLPSSSPAKVPASFEVGSPSMGLGWYGSEALAVRIPSDGKWKGMGPQHNYGDKLWFWRSGYDAQSERRPDLVIEGVRLGGAGAAEQQVHIKEATHGMGDGWSAMLVGMEFPSAGCWQVTANYRHAGTVQSLKFVVDVVAE